MTPRPVAVGLFAFTALLLSGCSPEAAVPSPPPAAEGKALFASDEEALAAAEAAFEQYLDGINTVLQEGGANPERIRDLVSEEVWKDDLEGAQRWQAEGLTSVGETSQQAVRLQQVFATSARTEVVTYNCLSNENVDVVNSEGESVASPDRASAYIVEAVVSFSAANEWVIERYTEVESLESCASWSS